MNILTGDGKDERPQGVDERSQVTLHVIAQDAQSPSAVDLADALKLEIVPRLDCASKSKCSTSRWLS